MSTDSEDARKASPGSSDDVGQKEDSSASGTSSPKKGKRKQSAMSSKETSQEKTEKRREANRRAAAESRQRRLDLIRNLEETAAALSEQIREVKEENEELKRQLKVALSGAGAPGVSTNPVVSGLRNSSATSQPQPQVPVNPFSLPQPTQMVIPQGFDASILTRLNPQQLATFFQLTQQNHYNQGANNLNAVLSMPNVPQQAPQQQQQNQGAGNEVLISVLADMLRKKENSSR